MFCEKCGTNLPQGSKFCHACGSIAPAPAAEPESPSPAPSAAARRYVKHAPRTEESSALSSPAISTASSQTRQTPVSAPTTGIGCGATIAIVLALLVVAIGIGGRAAAPTMAKPDCWQLGGDQGIGIRVMCAGDSSYGGFCAGLQSSSSGNLNPAAAACATPALLLQKVPFGVAAVVSLVIAGILVLPIIMASSSKGTRRA